MSAKLGDLIDGLTVLKDHFGADARILSVDEASVLYTHKNDVRIEDFTDNDLEDLMSAGWRWNEYDGCWEMQL